MKIKRIIKYLFLIAILYSCNQKENKDSMSPGFSVAVEDALNLMPLKYKEEHKFDTFTMPENNLELYNGIKEDYHDDQYSKMERLISKDLGFCIDTLMKIDKNNSVFEPVKSDFYNYKEWIVLSKKYKSYKTKTEVYIYLVYKSENEYYTFHLWDTLGLQSNPAVFQKFRNPVVFGQIRKHNDCFRNYKVNLNDSIIYFTISDCVNEIKLQKKKYQLDSMFK